MAIMILFLIFIVLGVAFNFYLFRQEQEHKQNSRFLTSERLIVFIIEILIAVIGFGITLAVTNANELAMEEDKAIRMMEQTIEYTDSQLTRDKSYLNMYNKGKIDSENLIVSSVISMDYYDNVLSNEMILQNANMNTYGEIMRYLEWIEYYDNGAKTATEDKKIYSKMYNRYAYLKRVRNLLGVCHDEMSGKITAEEAKELCDEIKYGKKEDSKEKDSEDKDVEKKES